MPKEKYNIQEGLKNLKALIKRLDEGKSSDPVPRPTRGFIDQELGGIIIGGELFFEYERVLQQLTPDDESRQTRTRDEIDHLTQIGVLKALDILKKSEDTTLEHRIDCEVEALRNQLTAPLVKWEVWRRVFGLKIPSNGFQFGRLLFCKPQHEAAVAAKKTIEAKINASPHADSYRKIVDIWPDDSQDAVLCRVEVQAGGGKGARHLAQVELDATLPVLNFFASLVTSTDRMPVVALREKATAPAVTEFALSDRGDLHWQNTEWRISSDFDINELLKNDVTKGASQKASGMLRGDGERKFADRLLAGMKWAGKGASARNKEDAFLFYAIALEALMLGGHTEQVNYRLSLRVGQLLGRKKSSKTQMRDIAKALYSVRSKIVHNGRTDIASVDLDDLRYIVQFCLERILCDGDFAGISTDGALDTWFEDALMNAVES